MGSNAQVVYTNSRPDPHRQRLTKRGLDMLLEIWIAADCPDKPEGDAADAPFAKVQYLKSHHGGSNVQRRAVAQVRARLWATGYLYIGVGEAMPGSPQEKLETTNVDGRIYDLGLTHKAFDALMEAGILKRR